MHNSIIKTLLKYDRILLSWTSYWVGLSFELKKYIYKFNLNKKMLKRRKIMFVGFNLKTEKNYEDFYNYGYEMYRNMEKAVQNKLDKYVGKDGSLNGSKMQEDWFPQVNADIFISHSHSDKRLATALAGWLHKKFGLTVFIDSWIWGYSDDLLKNIDQKYCINENRTSYDYQKRNFSTSHVHMMLSTALSMMIDKTECIVFLNTSNSTTNTQDIINNKTKSPWIYSEIVMTKLARKKNLSKQRMEKLQLLKKALNEYAQLDIKYDLELKHLLTLNDADLCKWESVVNKTKSNRLDALDDLYKMKNI